MAELANTATVRHAPGFKHEVPVADDLLERARLTRPWSALAVCLVLVVVALSTFYIDYAKFAHLGERYFARLDFWLDNFKGPVLIAYMLLGHRFVDYYGCRVITSIRPLIDLTDREFNQFIARVSRSVIRYQWLAILFGVALGGYLEGVWQWNVTREAWDNEAAAWTTIVEWNTVSEKAALVILYAVVSSLLYVAVARYVLFTRLYRQPMEVDVFDLRPLRPVAHWGLRISLTLIGGITMSILFVGVEDALAFTPSLVVYSIALTAAILIFFGSMFSTHQVMQRAKAREMAEVHINLSKLHAELKTRMKTRPPKGTDELASSVAAWVVYEKRIAEVPTWPYTWGTLGGLAASVLLPMGATAIQQSLVHFYP